jgi:hypothetical protein
MSTGHRVSFSRGDDDDWVSVTKNLLGEFNQSIEHIVYFNESESLYMKNKISNYDKKKQIKQNKKRRRRRILL